MYLRKQRFIIMGKHILGMRYLVILIHNYKIERKGNYETALFRSRKTLCLKSGVDKRDYNIDILFKPVRRMILPDSFDGIAIFVLEDDEIPKFLINDFGFTTRLEYKVFLIKTRDGNSYYINSGIMVIFHNQLDMLKSGWDRFSYYCGEKNYFLNNKIFDMSIN